MNSTLINTRDLPLESLVNVAAVNVAVATDAVIGTAVVTVVPLRVPDRLLLIAGCMWFKTSTTLT